MTTKVNSVINQITDGLVSHEITKLIDRNLGIMFQQTTNFKMTNKLAMFDLDGTIIFNKNLLPGLDCRANQLFHVL